MATVDPKTKCFICKKETRTFNCEGCSRNFCRNDLINHLQILNEQLDRIEKTRDDYREKFLDEKNDIFIREINQWEENSIEKIKQTAKSCRDKLINYKNKLTMKLENKLNDFTKQIQAIRQDNEFNEMDLNQLEDKFRKLKEEFDQSTNISIKQESISFINKISVIIPFSKDSKWKQNGLTVAGGNGQGNQLNQFVRPFDISINNDDQTIYIADSHNHRIVQWKSDAKHGQIIAGGNGHGNQINQLNHPRNVVFDKENHYLIISDFQNRRIMQWSLENNTNNGHIIISDIDCAGLAIDKDGSLYVSDYKKNEVRRWRHGEKYGTIVAGRNGCGNHLNQLNHPTYIFVDDDYSLYVSDMNNHRIIKWIKDSKQGIIVAGGNDKGKSLTQLSHPAGVIVDQFGHIYVSDYNNHRIMRWSEDAKEGSIVVEGEQSNQLNGPTGLSFDRHGNLYVVDLGNHRIQKFEID